MSREQIWTTKSLLEELAARKNLKTDYQLAKYLSTSQSSVSLWGKGARMMSDDWGFKFAQELQLDPAYVCLCLAAERSPDANLATSMRAWLVQHGSAAMIIFAVFLAVNPQFSHAAALAAQVGITLNACILC